MSIFNQTRQTQLVSKHNLANNPFSRMKGLLGRNELIDEALVIEPCNSIHMFFMKFNIDVIFVNQTNVVVGLVKSIKPFALSPIFFKAKKAIELPSGIIEKSQTQIGDTLRIMS